MATVTDGGTAVIDEVVADQGYHSNRVLVDLASLDLHTYIAEPDRGRAPLDDEGGAARRGVRQPPTDSRRAWACPATVPE